MSREAGAGAGAVPRQGGKPAATPKKTGGPRSIKKRNGVTVPFDAVKIREAIRKAGEAVPEEKFTKKKLDDLTAAVVAAIPGRRIPTVEQVQDLVEEARAELYRAQAEKLRGEMER